MALIIKTLGSGNLGGGPHDLYTVPASKSALISSARLVNVNSTNVASMNFFVRKSGTSTDYLLTKLMATTTASQSMVMEDPVTLGTGDKLRVDITGTNPNVDWQVNGVERDL